MPKLFSGLWSGLGRRLGASPRTAARSFRPDPIVSLVLCGVLLISAIMVGTAMVVGQFRERAITNSERELENTVLLVARHFDQQFEDAETIAADLISKLQISEISSPEVFRERMSDPKAREILRSKITGLSYSGEFGIFDSDGQMISWSGLLPVANINISNRSYFEYLKANPRAGARVEPIRSMLTGEWATIVGHRLSGANGIFLGVLSRRIDSPLFTKFFASVALGEGAAISMFHRDGTILARYPYAEAMIGKNLKSAPLIKRTLELGGMQTLRLQSPVDGQDRIGSAAELTRFPLIVVATKTVSAALADWGAQTKLMLTVAALSALVIAFILFLIIRQLTWQNRQTQQHLEAEKDRLDTALNNMTQGLVLYDASARVILCNRRYIDMYELSTEIVKPGCRFFDLIQHRKDTGSFDGSVDDFCSNILRNVAQGKITQTIMECADGRSFLIVNKPLPQGGWVATIEDISERQKIQQERDRNYQFLRQIIDNIPSQITVKDARDRRYLLVNRVAETQFGKFRDDIVGRTAADLFQNEIAEIIATDDEKVLQSADGLFRQERPWEHQNQSNRIITSTRIGIRDQAGGNQYIINVVDDITERRRAEEKIAHLAHYDALTELPNRVLFRQQIERELQRVTRGEKFALFYIDVDEFKGINDSLGHHVGDELLKAVANRIQDCIGERDLVARLGGDEFAVIQTNIAGADEVVRCVTRIQKAIREPYHCLGHQLSTDASIGIALAPQDGSDIDQLVKNADLAMYGAKSSGRRTYRFFEPSMDASAKARLAMEQDLRQALTEGSFDIHYQPLVDLQTDQVNGCEALLRWRHPERGMISPAEFIPVAEDTGLIIEIGEWVLRTACAEATSWPDSVRLAVNVSPVQLKCEGLALKVMSALASSGLAASRLELEITEAVLIRDDEAALAILHQLRAIGVRIALDDFGTGYSSLSYLKRFPFDKIKIDRCFVNDVAEKDGSSAIVEAVVNIAAARNMTTTAEGVETAEQKETLRALGCTQMQGYLFSAPKPGPDVRQLFERALRNVAAVA
jgi:diguanylate cyclase (GGDEF)-like protein/PAS domain S-box-containing protein